MSKNIGMLLDAYYPSDIRVHKEATALIDSGFNVFLLCKRRRGELVSESIEGIEVMRVYMGEGNASKGIIDILLALYFVHPVFKWKLDKFIRKHSIDVLHVHDLPLVKTAILKASKNEIKVVADFHENYPEALNVWFQWKKNPLIRLKNSIFFNYSRWSNYEKWATKNADHVIAVVDEMKKRLIEEHKVEEGKVEVITNTESKDFISSKLNEEIYGEDKDKFILAYTGGVGPHRGVDTAITGMQYLKKYDDIVLYITGSASKAAHDSMVKMVNEYGLDDQVKILGYRPFSEFYSFMKMARVNIIPHHSNGHTDNTVPHKLFQCMMTGNPILVSSSTPLKRIIEETNSGLYFEAGNSLDFANKVLELYINTNSCTRFGLNGLKSTMEGDLNWEHTSVVLKEFYSKI